jgi:hypothetical protein
MADRGNAEPAADPAMPEVYAGNISEAPITPSAVFVEADPAFLVDGANPEAFFDTSYDSVLARMIAHVIEIEGQVRDSVLARRIARAHGWQRTGPRIQERANALAAKAHRTAREDVGTFYWPNGRDPEPWMKSACRNWRAGAGGGCRGQERGGCGGCHGSGVGDGAFGGGESGKVGEGDGAGGGSMSNLSAHWKSRFLNEVADNSDHQPLLPSIAC